MSLQPQPVNPVPLQAAKIAKAAFPKGNTFMLLRDKLGTLFTNEDFAQLFASRGQPALSPWQLAFVTLMQFAEGLTDRQAADAVRARLDWKYALSLELTDSGFHYSVLSEFRDRLAGDSPENLLLDRLLEVCREQGWLRNRAKQRTTPPIFKLRCAPSTAWKWWVKPYARYSTSWRWLLRIGCVR